MKGATLRRIKQNILFWIFLIAIAVFGDSPIAALPNPCLKQGESLLYQGKVDQALDAFSPLVAKNDAHALYLSAAIYLSPTLGRLNPEKGLRLLTQSVEQNYPPALDELAGLYLEGKFVEKDQRKALTLYTMAAQRGYGPSQFNCGIMNKKGQGAAQNLREAYLNLCMASLNHQDLEDVTEDAARYRDEIAPLLMPEQRQEVLREVNIRTLPKGKQGTRPK
jgi:TPR repeat protein